MLTIEELLPRKWRRQFVRGCKKISPNKKVSWRNEFLFLVWGGERYDTRENIEKVLHQHEIYNVFLDAIVS